MIERITSTANPRVKHLVRLRRRRDRDQDRRFLIEGFRELSRAVEAGVAIETLYHCPELYLGENEPALVEALAASGADVMELGESACRKASYRDRPEGLLAVAEQFPTDLERLMLPHHALVLVLESIEKPGNLGTMLRTAEAAGVQGVIVCDPTTDPFNPNVVRASLGTLFLVPLAVSTTDETISWLRERGVSILASTPDGEVPHWEAGYRGSVAIVVGSEQLGLSDRWLEAADQRVIIPMAGHADSLNAAMATGILLFEAVRQRSIGSEM